MINAVTRIAKEHPHLFLFNAGVWGILAMLASDIVSSLDAHHFQSNWHGPVGPPLPPTPPFMLHWRAAAFSPAGLTVQAGIVLAGFCLMAFAVGRGIFRACTGRR